jgi:Co/Zn/Cd efflux system component
MEPHTHVFLGEGHEHAEKRTWTVIWLCAAMMALEIVGGLLFGSIALVADGLHMSTHAGALLLAALAYRYARRHATDARFTFGTGKLGDLAGFTSAIVLAMIALLIGWEAVSRFPPRFRVREPVPANAVWAETIRPDGARQRFVFTQLAGVLESIEEIPEPHAFTVNLHLGDATASALFEEHTHAGTHRDNNMRAAIVHVMADAAVSVLVIVGLLLARTFGWLWMDPLAGIVGACVIASWAYGLVRDTGRILLDMNPDRVLTERLRQEIESDGDQLTDLHIWRLGPGHLGAVLSIVTGKNRGPKDYRERLRHFASLSHITVEVQPR